MTASGTPSDPTRSGLHALADAALLVIDELGAGELLAAITPERLGQRSGYAPSSVRYQLSRSRQAPAAGQTQAEAAAATGRKRWAFDREHVLLIALEALAARQRETAVTSVARYLEALATVERTGDVTTLAHAVKVDLDEYTPGATDQAPALTSERVFAIALAASDGSVEVARQLRRDQDERMQIYAPVYERALRLTGRVLREGVTVIEIALQINMYLEGVSQRRRYEPGLDESRVLEAVLALFAALTHPAQGPAEPAPAAMLVGAVRPVGPG